MCFSARKNRVCGSSSWRYALKVELHYERKHEKLMTQKNVLRLGYNIFVSYISVMLFMAIVVTLGFYRKWKIEQEIEGLLWKINIESLLVSNTIYQGD